MSDRKSAQSNKADTNDIDEIVELIHGNTCPYTKPCPVVNSGKRAIQELIAQETNKALVAELKDLESLPNVYPDKIDGQYTHVHAIYKSAITERIKALTAEKDQA